VDESFEPELPVVTERLRLRALTTADRGALLAYRSLPEVCRFLPFPPMDAAEIDRRLDGQWRQYRPAAPRGMTLGIEVAATGELAGDVVLFLESRADETGELGWVLSPEHTGHGYATEAAAALLALAFDGMGLHRVVARMAPDNDASAAVATRLGMRREALMIENELIKGRWEDTLYYAILDREWRARGPHQEVGTLRTPVVQDPR
jgi:RimJ/RimL family protein N-acetyltransferase